MIGLKYIIDLYEMKGQDLAKELNIKQPNINLWTSGKQNVSKKHIPKLVEIFGVSEEFYQKELTEVDKLLIQKEKIVNELRNNSDYNQVKMDLENLNEISYEEVPLDGKIIEINNKISKAKVKEIIEEKIPDENMRFVEMILKLIEEYGDNTDILQDIEYLYRKYRL